jgi:hypothetical protein
VCLFLVARYGAPGVYSEKELDARLLPVDLAAVANLYDSEQIEYVRSRLTRREFASYERARGKVLIQYVKRFFQNSGLLVGYAHHIDVEGSAGIRSELLNRALTLRIESLRMLLLLYLKVCFPLLPIKLEALIFSYRLAITTARATNFETA